MMDVSVAYALPNVQQEITLSLPQNSTVREAIEASGILTQFRICVNELKVGIWGEETSLDTSLKPGDRVEIYRPLIIDPKQLRRERAKKP